MRFLFLIFLLVTRICFAIDFQKVSGTFEVKEDKSKLKQTDDSTYLSGTFKENKKNTSLRAPASVETEQETESINDVSGTFK